MFWGGCWIALATCARSQGELSYFGVCLSPGLSRCTASTVNVDERDISCPPSAITHIPIYPCIGSCFHHAAPQLELLKR